MIKLIKPYISYSDVESEFKEIFESGMFTRGKYVEQFATTLKEFTGAKEQEVEIFEMSLIYVNRLSDFLFVAARYANLEESISDIKWTSRAKALK